MIYFNGILLNSVTLYMYIYTSVKHTAIISLKYRPYNNKVNQNRLFSFNNLFVNNYTGLV